MLLLLKLNWNEQKINQINIVLYVECVHDNGSVKIPY